MNYLNNNDLFWLLTVRRRHSLPDSLTQVKRAGRNLCLVNLTNWTEISPRRGGSK